MQAARTPDILIIGGGLAGGAVAYALGRRGRSTVLLEQHPSLASGASGNRFGLLMPYITDTCSAPETIYSAGFEHSLRLLSEELQGKCEFYRSGGIQLPSTKRLQALAHRESSLLGNGRVRRVSAAEASALSGIEIPSTAFYAADAGYLSPPSLVHAFVNHHSSLHTVRVGESAHSVTRDGDEWVTTLSTGEQLRSHTVVVCSAYEASRLGICSWVPLEPIRGQVITAPMTTQSTALRALMCFDGYVTPCHGGEHLIGALYRHNDMSVDVVSTDAEEILERCTRALPALGLTGTRALQSRVSFRTSTFDRLPYIGQLPDIPTMRAQALQYQPGTNLTERVPLINHGGLYVSLGHGSRGLLSCPLGGEIIARLITGDSLGEFATAAALTDPARLVARLLKG